MKYRTMVVDPPWGVRVNWSDHDYAKDLPYQTMDDESLASLPVSDWLADDSLVFCWTVNSKIAAALRLLDSWGTIYWFTMTWVKPGGVQLPNGPAYNSEWAVVGRRGDPQLRETRAFSTANCWPRGAHSEKPEGFYDLLRRVTEGPRLDVFGRRSIAGFDSWGDEAPVETTREGYYQDVFA